MRTGFRFAVLAERSSNRVAAPKEKSQVTARSLDFFGAATQIRTGDLILTKDVLYQLSHSSIATGIPVTFVIITNVLVFVNTFLKYLKNFSRKIPSLGLPVTEKPLT